MFRTLGLLTLTFMLTGCGLWGNAGGKTDTRAVAASSTGGDVSGMPLLTALDGKMTFHALDELKPMSLPGLIERYPNPSSQPKVVMDNAAHSVVFTIDHTRAHTVSDMPTVRSSMSGVFHASYPGAKWRRDELADINGRTFAVFELEHGPSHDREHIIIYATFFKNTMLLVSLGITDPDIIRLGNAGRSMMNSITLRE